MDCNFKNGLILWERAFTGNTVFIQIGPLATYLKISFRGGHSFKGSVTPIKGVLTPKLIKAKNKHKKIKDFERRIPKKMKTSNLTSMLEAVHLFERLLDEAYGRKYNVSLSPSML